MSLSCGIDVGGTKIAGGVVDGEGAIVDANRAAVAVVAADDLDLVGIAFRAERKTVDKIVDRLRFHP